VVVNACFSKHRIEIENERDVSNCQLERQSRDVSSASDTLSKLTCDMKTLHQSLSEQSQWWLQVCSSFFVLHIHWLGNDWVIGFQ